MITSENQRETTFKPRIKLNHNSSLIYNIDFGFSGEAVRGIEVSTMQKGCHFMGMSQHFCSLLPECKILLLRTC